MQGLFKMLNLVNREKLVEAGLETRLGPHAQIAEAQDLARECIRKKYKGS